MTAWSSYSQCISYFGQIFWMAGKAAKNLYHDDASASLVQVEGITPKGSEVRLCHVILRDSVCILHRQHTTHLLQLASSFLFRPACASHTIYIPVGISICCCWLCVHNCASSLVALSTQKFLSFSLLREAFPHLGRILLEWKCWRNKVCVAGRLSHHYVPETLQ
jgi:hypothetical protein